MIRTLQTPSFCKTDGFVVKSKNLSTYPFLLNV